MSLKIVAGALVLILAPGIVRAQDPSEPDEEGCKDSPILTRMSGCWIQRCSVKDFDAMELQVGLMNDAGEAPMKALEGATAVLNFLCPSRLSSLQIVRNGENALKASGFTVVFSGKRGEQPTVTARKGAQWVQITGDPLNEFSGYELATIKTEEMAQEMEATADSLARELNLSGRAAVYGINFDTGKASLQPDSDKVLGQIATLLANNPSWKMGIEGHTDNVGAAAANQTLSTQRASAVTAWLVHQGVDPSRLTSRGFGDTRPLADNASEEGRAKNRRVELVKR